MKKNLFNRVLWECLAVCMASLLVIITGIYEIALSQSAAINDALNISGSEIDYSDDPAYQYFKSDYKDKDYAELTEYFQSVAEQIEGEGIVLLKNENDALPLSEKEKVSCMLSGSNKFNYGSSGSSASNTASYKDLKQALTDVGLEVNQTMWNFYQTSSSRKKIGDTYLINETSYDAIPSAAKTSLEDYGTVIVTIARSSGEGSDISATRSDGEDGSYLSLSEEEISVLQGLTMLKNQGKIEKIVVLLNSSATVQLDFLSRNGIDVDACLWVGNVGSAGINAVAKVLTGKIVPSGKLSDTYAKDNFSSPAAMQLSYNSGKSFAQTYSNYSEMGLNSTQMYYGIYSEGIYVGYRYYETRYTDYVTGRSNTGDYRYSDDVAYPFGYGISYTEFAYSDFSVTENEDGKSYDVTVTVTNTGDTYSGKEAVQVYLQKPYSEYDIEHGVEKAAVELVGYAKTEELAPGESSEPVTINVKKELFKSYDANYAKTYIVDEGDYYLTVANGAHEAANNILAAQGKTPENTDQRMDAAGNSVLAGKIAVNAFDDKTYSVSSETGASITNQLDDADLNKYEGSNTKVTYVSRNDWQGTMPKASISLNVTAKMKEDLRSNKDIETDPEAEMPSYGANNGLTLAMLRGKDYDDALWQDLLDQMTFGEQSYLISNGQYATVMVESVCKPDTREADGPTGYGKSQGSLSFPSEGIWASSFNNELIEKVGDCLAEDALYHGLSGLYANAINIHRMPFGGRSHEYFSEDPYLTAIAAVYEIQGMQAKGIIANVKHYAFNDEEAARNGIGVWLNEQEAREIMLLPFEYALSSAEGMGDAAAVMSGFNRAGTDWVGADQELLDIMREEWGFDGYCITDMASSNGASYMTYQDGVTGGTDVFLGSGSQTALNDFRKNATYCLAMREASHRILYSVCNYSAAMNGIGPDTKVLAASWWWKDTLIAVISVSAVLAASFGTMYAISLIKERKKKIDIE